jgi:hypothetical protein
MGSWLNLTKELAKKRKRGELKFSLILMLKTFLKVELKEFLIFTLLKK